MSSTISNVRPGKWKKNHFLPSVFCIIRFGTHVCGGDTVSRPLRINNPTMFGKYTLINIGCMHADRCTTGQFSISLLLTITSVCFPSAVRYPCGVGNIQRRSKRPSAGRGIGEARRRSLTGKCWRQRGCEHF